MNINQISALCGNPVISSFFQAYDRIRPLVRDQFQLNMLDAIRDAILEKIIKDPQMLMVEPPPPTAFTAPLVKFPLMESFENMLQDIASNYELYGNPIGIAAMQKARPDNTTRYGANRGGHGNAPRRSLDEFGSFSSFGRLHEATSASDNNPETPAFWEKRLSLAFSTGIPGDSNIAASILYSELNKVVSDIITAMRPALKNNGLTQIFMEKVLTRPLDFAPIIQAYNLTNADKAKKTSASSSPEAKSVKVRIAIHIIGGANADVLEDQLFEATNDGDLTGVSGITRVYYPFVDDVSAVVVHNQAAAFCADSLDNTRRVHVLVTPETKYMSEPLLQLHETVRTSIGGDFSRSFSIVGGNTLSKEQLTELQDMVNEGHAEAIAPAAATAVDQPGAGEIHSAFKGIPSGPWVPSYWHDRFRDNMYTDSNSPEYSEVAHHIIGYDLCYYVKSALNGFTTPEHAVEFIKLMKAKPVVFDDVLDQFVKQHGLVLEEVKAPAAAPSNEELILAIDPAIVMANFEEALGKFLISYVTGCDVQERSVLQEVLSTKQSTEHWNNALSHAGRRLNLNTN